jgi:nitroreductase
MTDWIRARYGDGPPAAPDALEDMLIRGSCRVYKPDPVPRETLEVLAASALAAPTKSDLQQRDILFVADPVLRGWIDGLFPEMPWIADAPHFVVFLANNRRQRQVHAWRGRPFANDHLDAFFNASVDAAVALAAFVAAAERLGLGACPISALRDHAQAVSDRLALPDHVFPICGLTLGHPVYPPRISPRLDLGHTVHWDRFSEDGVREAVAAYDVRRNQTRPFSSQRDPGRFGEDPAYGWSEDKARQYATSQRADFGAFIRRKGFDLS